MVVSALIIGGGFAGLSAAVQLVDAGLRVTLLEKKSHLGGRVYSIPDRESGDWIDNGQHVLMGCYHETLELMRRIGTLESVRFQKTLSVSYRGMDAGADLLHCPVLPGPLHLLAGLKKMQSLSFSDKLAALRYGLSLKLHGARKDETIHQMSSRLRQPSAIRQRLWDPIALSAMNEETASADAGVFARVLKDAFFGKARDSRLGLPIKPLSEMHGESAINYLLKHEGRVELNAKAKAFDWDQSRIKGVALANGEHIQCDLCINATPPSALQKMLLASGLETMISAPDLGTSPILSLYLWFDEEVADEDFCCLQQSTFEWAFHRKRFMNEGEHAKPCVCLVASAARRLDGLSREEIIRRGMDDLRRAYGTRVPEQPTQATVFWEKEATFSCTPENNKKRPAAKTALKNFFLAGDWTQTGLPATIEGAVRSGNNAAKAALTYLKEKERSRF
ncbi:MAG: hydroxysqualene dehydroxylase HpnE [Candidatus Hinthialibacter antarcticus]|nr:hydroxysqualene dehydroxylase HpnE [Candidatus Hinthialibacter antarcticus]